MTDLERFMSHTKRDPETGCLMWTHGKFPKGYGTFKAQGKSHRAHRWIFQEMYGYLPEVVMHRCDTPGCVDWIKCLRPGTFALNNADRASKDRSAGGERNGNSRLTDEEVRQIRAKHSTGASCRSLARLYGVSDVQIGNIVRHKQRIKA